MIDDAATLLLRWKNVSWTQASLQRVLEVFTLALLRVKYSRQGRGIGADMGQLTPDATCLLCKKQVIRRGEVRSKLPDRG